MAGRCHRFLLNLSELTTFHRTTILPSTSAYGRTAGYSSSRRASSHAGPFLLLALAAATGLSSQFLMGCGAAAAALHPAMQSNALSEAKADVPAAGTVGAALQPNTSSAAGEEARSNSSADPAIPRSPGQLPALNSGHPKIKVQRATLASAVPASSVFTPPALNACQSNYDQFYEAEPGVYSFWALCEAGSPLQIYDYAGSFDLSLTSSSWGSGVVTGGSAGPVDDGETAATVPTANIFIENQGIPLNTNQGTVALWINASALGYPVNAAYFGAVTGKSGVTISTNSSTNGLCFNGTLTDSTGATSLSQRCGYTANTWHRLALTWKSGHLSLYVDGSWVATSVYTGMLDNNVFYYKLFPGCCNTGQQMTLAKISISNQQWTSTQISSDFSPVFPPVPTGGVYVSAQKLGTIHKDVLGVADFSQNISTPALQNALLTGFTAGGVTSLRYSGGRGMKMDLEDWQNDDSCGSTPGASVAESAQNIALDNTIDTYIPEIAQPLGLDVVYTANYGTNPYQCDAGGDPVINGANLVQYANFTQNYGIKRWEVGNEMFSTNSTDFHPNPNTGASYVQYEPAYYAAMKAQDPTIQIGVPIDLSAYSSQSAFDFPVLAGASYDVAVWHNYPMKDPITDGATLYQDRVTSNMARTRGSLLKLETELLNNNKSSDSIWITEWDGEVMGDKWSKQTLGAVMPLFAATQLAEYMQAGVQLATWWGQGGTDVCSTLNYDSGGETAYSWWECGMDAFTYTGPMGGVQEVLVGFQPGEITPAARAFQLLSQSGFVTEGEHMLRTQTDIQNSPWLLSYAATHGSSKALILMNRDQNNTYTVPVTIAGMASGSSAQQWTYGRTQYDNSSTGNWSVGPVTSSYGAWAGSFQAVLPPWSVSVIVLKK